MSLRIEDIDRLMTRHGASLYGGEAVSQLSHALQAAHLAQQANEPTAMVVAAALHDLGHLICAQNSNNAALAGDTDAVHEYMVLPFLRATFGPAVLEPIRMHVQAKRYLCLVESGYWASLSPASQHSMSLQGGVLTVPQVEAFIQQAYAQDAVRLRRYDDLAKDPYAPTPPWQHVLDLMRQVVL
jgi:phosphonate degradation associated HDIG domain protein